MPTRYKSLILNDEQLFEFINDNDGVKEMIAHNADCHLIRLDVLGNVRALCSLWHSDTPRLGEKKTGFIGHYFANDDQSGLDLLDFALQTLSQKRCDIAIGPIDGSTWRKYRLAIDDQTTPSFRLDLVNPVAYTTQFKAAGFGMLSKYTSAKLDNLNEQLPVPAPFMRRVESGELTVRQFDITATEQELKAIFTLSKRAFADNLLYSDISELEFLAASRKLYPLLDPRLITLVERADQLVAFVLLLPDEVQSDGRRSAILKTIARAPEDGLSGAGRFLFNTAHECARNAGFSSVIHAFMIDGGKSKELSKYNARTIREYALFARGLR